MNDLSARDFEVLATELQRDTAITSNLTSKTNHWAYRQMLSQGRKVIPYVINTFDSDLFSIGFFVLLREVAGIDAAKGENTVAGAQDKWHQWAKEQGYV